METGYEKAGLRGRNENGESSEFRLPIWAKNFNSKMYVLPSTFIPFNSQLAFIRCITRKAKANAREDYTSVIFFCKLNALSLQSLLVLTFQKLY